MSLFINIYFDYTIQIHGYTVFCEDNDLSSKKEKKDNIKEQQIKLRATTMLFDFF